jgi:hypothetical protein
VAGGAINPHEVALPEIPDPRGIEGEHSPVSQVPGMFPMKAGASATVNRRVRPSPLRDRGGPVADRVAAGFSLKPSKTAAVAWGLWGGVGKAPEIVAGGNRALAPPISRADHHRAGARTPRPPAITSPASASNRGGRERAKRGAATRAACQSPSAPSVGRSRNLRSLGSVGWRR